MAVNLTAPNPFKTTPTRTRIVTSTTVTSLSRWSVASVRSALDSLERGELSSASQLCDAVLRDPHISAHLNTRVSALTARGSLPFCVEPSEGVDDRRAESAARAVERLWWTSCPTHEVEALHRDAVMLGVGVGRVLFDAAWNPSFYRLRPHGLWWSESERCYRYIDGDGRNHVVTPGLNGWVLHAPHGTDSHLRGAIRSLGIPWLGKVYATRDWLRYSEKHGMPALAVKEPYFATDDVEQGKGDSQLASFYGDVRKLGEDGVLRLPQGQSKDQPGWEAEWLELRSTSHEGFKALLEELDRQVIAPLLGRDPRSASDVGGDGASLQERVRAEFLIADADRLATTLRDQVWVPWAHYVYGPDLEQLAPWPHWDTRPPPDLKLRAETLLTAAQALEKLAALGIDTAPLLEELSLKRNQ